MTRRYAAQDIRIGSASNGLEIARTRLNHLKLELKGQSKASENKMLGIYERNIGLKYGPTYGSRG
jgi:hypothetical protein